MLRMAEPPRYQEIGSGAAYRAQTVDQPHEAYPLRPPVQMPEPGPADTTYSSPLPPQMPSAPYPAFPPYPQPSCRCCCPYRANMPQQMPSLPPFYQQLAPSAAPTGKAASILSLVFGILSLLNILLDFLSSAFAIAAIVLGIVGLVRYGKRERLSGMALTGLLLAIAALFLQPFFPTLEEILVDVPYYYYPGEAVTPCKLSLL